MMCDCDRKLLGNEDFEGKNRHWKEYITDDGLLRGGLFID
jgi:hypothetical protein